MFRLSKGIGKDRLSPRFAFIFAFQPFRFWEQWERVLTRIYFDICICIIVSKQSVSNKVTSSNCLKYWNDRIRNRWVVFGMAHRLLRIDYIIIRKVNVIISYNEYISHINKNSIIIKHIRIILPIEHHYFPEIIFLPAQKKIPTKRKFIPVTYETKPGGIFEREFLRPISLSRAVYPIVPGNSLTLPPCGSSSRAVNVNPGQLCYWVIIPGKPWGSTREKKKKKRGRRKTREKGWWGASLRGLENGGWEEQRIHATGSILLNRLEKRNGENSSLKTPLSSPFSFVHLITFNYRSINGICRASFTWRRITLLSIINFILIWSIHLLKLWRFLDTRLESNNYNYKISLTII